MTTIEISGVCRCCLSQSENLNDLFISYESMNVPEAIQDICGIDVYADSCLPDQICDVCLECLKASYSFRIRTKQSDNTLHNILEGNIVAKEIIDDIEETEEINQTEFITDELEFPIIEVDDNMPTNDNENTCQELDDIPLDKDPIDCSLQCPHCQKEFLHLRNLRAHIGKHFSEGKFSCAYCPNKYHTKFDVQRHMTKIHSDGCALKCELCDKEFPTKPELNRHLRTHDSKKPFSCPVCGMMFKMKHNAQQHIDSHEKKKKRFFCEICGKGFVFASKLSDHNKSVCKPIVQISGFQEEEVEL